MARAKTKKAPARKAPAPKTAKGAGKPSKAKATKPARPTKGKPAAAREADEAAEVQEAEPSDTELMLQTLACPTSTADRLSELCEAAVLRVKEDLTGIAAAELVWRKRPEREAVSVAIQGLATELERHGEVMVALYDQLRNIAEDESDHGDLEIPDVIERLRPLLNSLPPEE